MSARQLTFAALCLSAAAVPTVRSTTSSCDTVETGYTCDTAISEQWGEYAPWFTLKSESTISENVPAGCVVNFVQLLNRHGARYPTTSKSEDYNATILALQKDVTSFTGEYAFLKDFVYNLGSENLTVFGQQELINAGINFYDRYPLLTADNIPFIRADAEYRVVESAYNWTQGYHESRQADLLAILEPDSYPYSVLQLSDATGYNNTLSASTCNNFENGYESDTGSDAQATYAATFVPAISARLNAALPGADLSTKETIYLMDLCPFETVNSVGGATISPFCALFTTAEWQDYGYYQTLGKYYGYGNGNFLGSTQGAGWVNELIARLTSTKVVPGDAVNSTLDDSSATFPLGKVLYADFSHDDQMTSIFAALGLYNNSGTVSNTTLETATQLDGYSASWTVPFASRLYFEKLTCLGESQEMVRAIINDRVVPLVGCDANKDGMCTLDAFVKSQNFSQNLGLWNQYC